MWFSSRSIVSVTVSTGAFSHHFSVTLSVFLERWEERGIPKITHATREYMQYLKMLKPTYPLIRHLLQDYNSAQKHRRGAEEISWAGEEYCLMFRKRRLRFRYEFLAFRGWSLPFIFGPRLRNRILKMTTPDSLLQEFLWGSNIWNWLLKKAAHSVSAAQASFLTPSEKVMRCETRA